MRPPLHFQSGADAPSPAGPRGGNARISPKALSTAVLGLYLEGWRRVPLPELQAKPTSQFASPVSVWPWSL